MEKICEENFVRKLRERDEQALRYVIEQYAPLYKNIIHRRLSSMPQYREECLDDVLMSIWEHIGQFDEERGSFRGWSCAIARCLALNYLRRYRKDSWNLPLEELGEIPAKEDERFCWEEDLEEMIQPLAEKDRVIFRQLFVESLSVKEVAESHQIGEGALYSRLSRARRKLKEWYGRGEKS